MSLVTPYVNIDNTQPADRAIHWGVLSPDFGALTLNSYLLNANGTRKMFKFIYVVATGDVVIEKLDGTTATLPAVPAETFLPTAGWRIVTGTTATPIYWFGGQGGYNQIG